jgi:hypothetical protein
MSKGQWREPTLRLRLRWGRYADRYVAGIVLIVGGAIQLQGANNWTLPLLLIGAVTHAIGWGIMPARGWRRIIALMPSSAILWLLLTGPFSMWMLSITLACWLLVRHRPLRSYVTVLIPLANGVIVAQFVHEYSWMPVVLVISMAVLVASAWLARLIATTVRQRETEHILSKTS